MNERREGSSLPLLAGITKLGEDKLSVRANWNTGVTAQPDQDDLDPFDGMGDKSILTDKSPPAQFRERLSRLHKRLEMLTAMGVTCPLREEGECHCASCPISQINEPDGERHRLCKQGVEEERTVMLSRVASLGLLAPSGV